MAIKRTKDSGGSQVPAKLDELLRQAFSFQAIRDKYDEAYDGSRKEVVNYLENNDDGFEVELSKGFKHEYGSIVYAQRSNWSFDKDKIIELVKSGKVTIETIVNLASFNAEKLKTAVGEKAFHELASQSSTEYLTLKATQEFKNEVAEKFGDLLPKSEPAPAPKPSKIEKELKAIEEKPKSSLDKIKALKTKSKPKKSADEELDDILKD